MGENKIKDMWDDVTFHPPYSPPSAEEPTIWAWGEHIPVSEFVKRYDAEHGDG